jgi:tRNA(Leu) C34 or U34 (ribose-2'-O)-methylase TrmL
MRGYACVALVDPKYGGNVGAVMRAIGCYGATLLVVAGGRFRKENPDTHKAWRHVPVVHGLADVFDGLPYGCTAVAVDLLEGAVPLPRYQHPERAMYIFGAEDATLDERVVARCRDRVMVPTRYCMNLAATVNVVLYDRMAKSGGGA